jgi:hypothetical protein
VQAADASVAWHGLARTLLVSCGPKRGATRHWLTLLLGLAVPTTNAIAGDVPPLTLPVGAALALVVSAVEARHGGITLPVRPSSMRTRNHPPPPSFIPRRIHIPDSYSEEFERPLRSWVAPTDSDRIVSLDLFPRPQRGWMISVAYDEESSGPYTTADQVFGITFEYEF